MQDSFSLSEYFRYLNSKWRWIGASAVVAGTVALVISLVLPSQYTATARLIVEPPAGADARTPQVVTPQYLESLRTYESLATSDSLFERAIKHFDLRRLKPGRSIESWKRSTLRAGFVRNTKVLEIAVTLPDASMAQRMARFLAEGTIALSRELQRNADQELIGEAEKEFSAGQKAFDELEAQWSRALRSENKEALQSEIYARQYRQNRIERQLLDAQVSKAGERANLLAAEREAAARSLTQLHARLAAYEEKLRPIEERRKVALARLGEARKRLDEAKGMAGYRGERLRMIDPGIVPERPSSPNILLNVAGAAFFALALSLLFLSLRFGASGDRA